MQGGRRARPACRGEPGRCTVANMIAGKKMKPDKAAEAWVKANPGSSGLSGGRAAAPLLERLAAHGERQPAAGLPAAQGA